MGIVFVPLYIHFIGIEAYGLVGVFACLLGIFGFLDMGLSSTMNREMARLAVQEDKAQDMRDLLRTLEIPYCIVGLLIAVVVIMASPLIANHWVQVKELSPKTVRIAIMLMGLCVAARWPIGFYSGGLMGLQRQVLLNVINIVVATFRGVGAILILWLIAPTVEAFFSWQLVVSIVHVSLIVFFLRRSLPHAAESPRFRLRLLKSVWRFAAGMTGIGVASTLLMQLDKVILSRMLSLDAFGYYTLASVMATTLYRLVSPVYAATYPRLTNLVQMHSDEELARLYHKSAQLVSMLVLPVALVIALFSKDILLLWTRNAVTAEQTHLLVTLLVTGTAIHCMMFIPYALQLAYGWTRLALCINVVSVVLLVPLMIVLATWYGAVGAASVWIILNVGYIVFGIHIMHQRLLHNEKRRWYFEDVGRPLLAAVVVGAIGRYVINPDWSFFLLLVSLGVVSGTTLLASVLAANQLDAVGRMKSLLTTLHVGRATMGKTR